MGRDISLIVTRRNFSLVAPYSLKFTRCSLLVVKSLVTRGKIRSLLVAEVARSKKSLVTRSKKSLVTRCKIRSLQKITRYLLQSSLVTRCKSCSLQKITGYSLQNSLFARYNKSLVTRCKKSFITR